MRRLVTARKRADMFAEAVDGRSAELSNAEHQMFLDLVDQLRVVERPTLRPDFATDLRERLMAEAPEALAVTAPLGARSRRDSAVVTFPASPRRRTATIAAAACIVLGSTAGVAAASQAALPGEMLYPVKRGIEHVELAVAGSAHAKGSEYLDQASTRLDEVTDLTVAHGDDPGTPALVRQALEDFSSQAEDGADELMSAYRDDNDASSIAELRSFAEVSAQRLDALTGTIPAEASDALADAADMLTQLDRSARSLCPDCSSLPSLTLSAGLINLQDTGNTTGTTLPTGPNAPATPNISGPTTAGLTQPSDGPVQTGDPGGTTATGDSTGDPTLLVVPSGLGPTPTGPTATSDPKEPTSAGVSVPLPNGGGISVGTTAPSVPVPTVDLDDPAGSIPDVVDDVTSGLGVDLP